LAGKTSKKVIFRVAGELVEVILFLNSN